jgi:hypothetical protein
MNLLSKIAPVTGLCSFGLAIYTAFWRGDKLAAGICLGIFLLSVALIFLTRRAAQSSGEPTSTVKQTQRSGAHSTNIQAGRDVSIGGGGEHGR